MYYDELSHERELRNMREKSVYVVALDGGLLERDQRENFRERTSRLVRIYKLDIG